jgi:hypothetical protein
MEKIQSKVPIPVDVSHYTGEFLTNETSCGHFLAREPTGKPPSLLGTWLPPGHNNAHRGHSTCRSIRVLDTVEGSVQGTFYRSMLAGRGGPRLHVNTFHTARTSTSIPLNRRLSWLFTPKGPETFTRLDIIRCQRPESSRLYKTQYKTVQAGFLNLFLQNYHTNQRCCIYRQKKNIMHLWTLQTINQA